MYSFRIIYSAIALFILISAGCSVKRENAGFSISGSLKNHKNKLLVLTLEEDINRKQAREIAQIPVNEQGNFAVDFDLEPHIYTLKFPDQKTKILAVGKGQNIVIEDDVKTSAVKVSGSEDTNKLEAYENFRKESLDRLVISVRNEIKLLKAKNTPEDDPQLVKLSNLEIENYNKHKDELIEFIQKNMGTSIAVYATSIRWDGDHNLPFLESLATEFEKTHPGLAVTEKIKEKVKILKNTSIGGRADDIIMPDKNGQEAALSSLNAKYILIDFWASWCAPCRRESPELVNLYNKYNPKGFEIYGVALESEKENWLDAIASDQRIWKNVSTLREFETPAAFQYAVTSLPANFLIDSDRKIIGKNLHGEELRSTLERLFED